MEHIPKKRGRKPKSEYYLNKKIDKVDTKDKAIIINLPIKTDFYEDRDNSLREQEIIGCFTSTILPYEDNSTNFDVYCKDETEVFVTGNDRKIQIKDKTYYNIDIIPKTLSKGDVHLKMRTDIHCYWCCHQFDTQPVFMPCRMKRDVFVVKNVFCSFECCYSYMSSISKYSGNIHLLKYMYHIYTGKKFFRDTLVKAPEKECLKIFGGPLGIEEFRNKSNRYEIHSQPMCYVTGMVEKIVIKQEKVNEDCGVFSDFVKKI